MPRVHSILLWMIIALFPVQSVFSATRYYVNINNPTPGAGTSWATAFNDLSVALATAGNNDTLWVAAGTYTPTTGVDRRVAFVPKTGMAIYGGFAGTELAFSERDWRGHAAVLSGDIGLVGDASDNSYSVLRISGDMQLLIDGFTIRDGFADGAGVYGTGGGISIYLSSGHVGLVCQHVIFARNYAVYGGGLGGYGIGTPYISTNINKCEFNDNSAVTGGAISYNLVNGATGYNPLDNCIFRRNNATSGHGSVLANMVDGPVTHYPFLQNVVMYDNGEDLLYCTLTNGAETQPFNGIYLQYAIVWRSSGQYGASNFSNAKIVWRDLDIAVPDEILPVNCINSDPQFVDADFHVAPCSPCVDGTIVSSTTYTTDFAGNPRVQGGKVDMGIYESTKTVSPAPANSSVSYCQDAVAEELTGAGLLWYTSATSGTGMSAITPSTAAIGNTYYYMTQTVAGSCESARGYVYVSVLAKPAAPAVADVGYCEGEVAVPLGPNSASYNWYTTETGGTGTTSAPTPLTGTAGEVTYYKVYKVGGCESERSPLKVTVRGRSAMPVVEDVSYCVDATASALTAVGANLRWYTDGVGSATAPTPVTTDAGVTTYYVTQNEGCESLKASVNVTVGSVLGAPLTRDVAYCENSTAMQLSASGTNLIWYTDGVGSTTAPTPETLVPGVFTYYVTQSDAVGCESARAAVTVTVHAAPAAPLVEDLSYCVHEAVPALTAVGTNLRWYTGGVGSATAPTPVTLEPGVFTYYVTQSDGCESLRAAVNVTVNKTAAPVVAPVTLCQGMEASPLIAGGRDLLWYTSSAGGVGSAVAPTPVTLVPGNVTYYVSQRDGCESARAALEVTVLGAPEADFTTSGGCVGTPMEVTLVPAVSKTAFYTWNFENAVEVKGDDGGPYKVLWNTPGDYMVTLMAYDGMCEAKVLHTVSVGVAPDVKVSGGGFYCINNTVVLEASGAETYSWSPSLLLSAASGEEVRAMFRGDAIYTVTGVDGNGCVATAEVGLRVDPGCRVSYVMPTAFTPNGDGRNDFFRVKTTDVPREFTMLVFNRVGQLVYEGHDALVGWDGMVKGRDALAGEYVWVIAAVSGDGRKVEQKGSVVLVR